MIQSDLIFHEFSGIGDVLYFNSAYMGPYPLRTQTAIKAMVDRMALPAKFDYSWVALPDGVRAQLAKLLGQSADYFSINSSTGEAVSFYASGCTLRAGDRVALFKDEYPSDVLPWMFAQKSRGGFEIDFYDKNLLWDLDAFKKALHPQTRFLNISHVGFQTGNRADLSNIGKFLRERDIRFIVDATQGLGGISITADEMELIDLLVCSTYKWFLSPYGQAFALWSKRALQETVQTHGNWLTQPNSPQGLTIYTTESKAGARRFDRGQAPNVLGVKGLEASLSLFKELGLKEIEKHNLSLTDYFIENFDRSRYELVTRRELKSSILCLKSKSGDSVTLQQKLESRNVDLSVREGNLRVSFHLFNTRAQVESLLKAL